MMSGITQRAFAIALGISGALLVSSPSTAATGAWYIGAGGGISKLSPDTTGSPFTLEDDQGTATSIYFGLDINDWLSAEAAYTDLGEAMLSQNQSISYVAASVGGIAYVYRNRGLYARQEGLSGYLRLGLNSIRNESEVLLNEADNTAVWIGAGLQYPLGRRFGIRAEVASVDGDAQVALASLYWRSRNDGDVNGRIVSATTAEDNQYSNGSDDLNDEFESEVEEFDSYDDDANFDIAADDGFGDEFEDEFGDEFGDEFADADDDFDTEMLGSDDEFDTAMLDTESVDTSFASTAECNEPAAGEPTDPAGCALFTGVIEGVDFQDGTASLTPQAEIALENLAARLRQYPNVTVELQTHTEQFGQSGVAMQLSRERALAVARYLTEQSVNVERLQARAFGSTQPRFDNGSPEGRRMNNRVELRVN